jgi:hypothetical protein
MPMLGQSLWAALIVLLLAVLLSQLFPGRRVPPAATAEWRAHAALVGDRN